MLRMVGTVLLGVALAYGALVGLIYVSQDRLVYFPEIGGRELAVNPGSVGLPFEDVSLATSDGETLHGWFVPAKAPRGAVLFCHGNAGNISHRLDSLLMFYRMGYSVLIYDYRGYGRSTGRPTEQGTYLDAEAAWVYLTETRGFAPQRIAVFGESLGGAVAAWLAARHPPGALVLASTFTSVPDMGAAVYPFLPVRLLARIRYDARDSVGRVPAPVFVAHSPEDEIVPFAQGQALFAAAGEPKQFLELAGGHNDGFIFVREAWVRALAQFLDSHLGAAPVAESG
ncbi:MAG TPA: alpha/beta hydrolase [Burkholderiales bacterium]|nr:alpha/beta hydrolase [Burkholderiales bacterium]